MYQMTLVMSLRSKPLGGILLGWVVGRSSHRARRAFGLALNVLNLMSLRSKPLKIKSLPLMNADKHGSKALTT